MTDTISLLLAIEARDRASAILDQIAGKVKGWEASMKAAADQSKMTSEQVEAANLKAEASAASYDRAVASQAAAQRELATAMDLSKQAQEQATLAAQAGATEQKLAAGEVKAAAEMEEAALVKLQRAEELTKTRAEEMAAAQEAVATKSTLAKDAMAGAVVAAGAVAIGVGIIGEKSIKSAADFQTGMVKLTTTAGESQKNLAGVSAGVLQLAGDIGTTTENLSDGAYRVESAGFHGANALNVLRAAGEASRAEGAQMDTVTRALTSALNAYGDTVGKTAIPMTNEIIAAVGHGDMRMQDFASSLSAVLPIAAAAKISFAEVGGAVATMTAQGMSADQATQNLAHTIGKFQHATPAMTQYLWQLGIDSQDLAAHLGDRGLTGTIQIVSDAILKHMGPSGQVVVDIMNKSKSAADDARQMISKMPPELAKTAKAFLDGSITVGDWRQAIKDLPGDQEGMAKQFQSLVDQADGFNQAMKSGQPNVKEYTAALYAATGDQTAMNTVLKLSGDHMQVFKDNVDAVSASGRQAGHDIAGWSDITGTFNFKMDALKGRLEAAKIAIGTGLLPAVTDITSKVISFLTPITNWMTTHEHLTAIILGSIAALATLTLTIAAVAKTVTTLKLAWEAVTLAGGKLAPVANMIKLSVTEATTAMATAAPTAGAYGTAVAGIAGGAKGAATGLKGLVTSISPVGIALTALTIGVGYYIDKSQEQKQRVDSLASALMTLGQAYRQTHDLTSQSVQDAIKQNDQLTELVDNSDRYGLSVKTITEATSGQKDAQKQVIASLEQQRTALDNLAKQEQKEDTQHFKFWSARVDRTEKEKGQVYTLEQALKQQFDAMDKIDQADQKLSASGKQLSQSDQDLLTKLGQLQSGNLNAADASDALKSAQDRLYGAQISVTEADQAYHAAQLQLTQSIQDNKQEWDLNSEAGLHNRQALEGAMKATVDLYQSQIAAKVPEKDAIALHDQHIKSLVDQAHAAGLDDATIQDLVKTYGTIPDVKKTMLQLMGYDDVNAKLDNLSYSQRALIEGITPQQARKLYWGGANADGGYITGPGGPRDDRIVSLLSNGEYVMPAHIVNRHGVGFFDQLRAGSMPGDGAALQVPGYATGGLVAWPPKGAAWPFTVNVSKTKIPSEDQVLSAMASHMGGGSGASQWAGVALSVLNQLGQPASYLGAALRRINLESGGNPTIVNTSDINWANGTPSVGLAQVIGPTFDAYAGPYRNVGPFEYGVSTNPYANLYAGFNYATQTYGSVAAIDPIVHPGGYASGGLVRVRDRGGPVYPGRNVIYNGTGRTEYIADPRGGGAGTQVTFDFRGSQIMSERDIDMLIQRIERRFVQELLPGAGVQLQR